MGEIYLKSILEPVDDRPGGAHVPVDCLGLGDSLKGSLRLQVIGDGGDNVATASGQRLVLRLGLGFGIEGGYGQAQAGRAAVVGAGLASMATKKRENHDFQFFLSMFFFFEMHQY